MLTRQVIPSAALKELLKNFRIGKIRKITPLETSGNIAYYITTNVKKYVLRLAPSGPRWRSRKEIHAELEVIANLRRHKLPAVMPVSGINGEMVVGWKKHYGYLREFVDGQPKMNPTPKEIQRFGEFFGKFHVLTRNYKTRYRRMHRWDLEETKKNFKYNKPLLRKSAFKQKNQFMTIYARELGALNFPESLPSGTIHEDLGRRHVLWRNNKIIGILDFDRSYYGKFILDFGQSCRGWCFTKNWSKWNNENFQVLLKGYQSERSLTDLEKKYVVDAIKFGILERALSFCLRYIYITHDPADVDFALYSISEKGPLGMVEKNRNNIEQCFK